MIQSVQRRLYALVLVDACFNHGDMPLPKGRDAMTSLAELSYPISTPTVNYDAPV